MKRLILILFVIFMLTSCDKNIDEHLDESTSTYVNENDFLEIRSNQIFTENTYYLDLKIDDEEKSLTVIGVLVYIAGEAINELDLKLYPNAVTENENDIVNIHYIKVNDETMEASFSGNDRTTIHLDLAQEVQKDDKVFIEFSYEFNYWDGERIAYYNDYYITMFFYPFVAMKGDYSLETYDYSFIGESYYNEIGDYFVSIDVPSDFKIASSGKEVKEIQVDSRVIRNYYLNNGRDFSFSASSLYHTYVKEVDGITHTIYAIQALSDYVVEENFSTLENAFRIYQDYVGDYPYDYFNLEFGNVYGMESSGVVYCSSDISIYTVVHEIIHQWFYSIIHNDQANEPFLDEALTTYTTFIYFYEVEGLDFANGYLDYRSSLKTGFEGYLETYRGLSLLENVDAYENGYAYIIYYHGPTLYRYYFDALFGSDFTVLKQFLNAYYDEYSYKEVTTKEMLELLEETTGYESTVEWFNAELISLGEPEPLD